jgi:hypothetical protein
VLRFLAKRFAHETRDSALFLAPIPVSHLE